MNSDIHWFRCRNVQHQAGSQKRRKQKGKKKVVAQCIGCVSSGNFPELPMMSADPENGYKASFAFHKCLLYKKILKLNTVVFRNHLIRLFCWSPPFPSASSLFTWVFNFQFVTSFSFVTYRFFGLFQEIKEIRKKKRGFARKTGDGG